MGSKQGWDIPNKRNKKTGKLESMNVIYVLGTVDGRFYRKSTKKEATKLNIAWIKKNHRDVLLQLIDKDKEKLMPTKKTDLESFGTMVLETSARGRRSANSQKCKIGNFKNHILPYFENYSLNDIKTTDVEVWQNKLLEKYSTSTVKKCRDILNLIFKKAQADDLVNKNYVEFVDNIAVESSILKRRT
jgi:acylphosphatase